MFDWLHRFFSRTPRKFGSACDMHCPSPVFELIEHSIAGRVVPLTALLQNGVDPNDHDQKGRTALREAIAHDNLLVVQILLERGANPNARDKYGYTPLHWVVGGHMLHDKSFKELLAGLPSKEIQELKTREERLLEILRLLLKAGADINNQDQSVGFTPLIDASTKGNWPAVQLLLQFKPDLNLRTKEFGFTALSFATTEGYERVVELLLDAGANPDIQDNQGWTALMMASKQGFEEIVHKLLKRTAKSGLMLMNDKRQTAMDLAKINNHTGIRKLLDAAWRGNLT